ncbi:MAG: DUF427 domain-containing protein [Roseibium sp.]|uniref:DUF427 domain-containing protein n=1 Tax=Roseibium sp. TaxID=1936156 RepID=UPI00262F9E82|nr:DUF427 domain-containing protein [Roseibium sp.]MCV0424701.1 DUF427 domain-containing protein [Roseibium sp.]
MNVLATAAFENAVRNPSNPDHLMVIKDVPRRIRIYANDTLLADSTNALRVLEIGKSVYDPVVYIPKTDLTAEFEPVEKSTYCPIKGDASYVALDGDEIGWVYEAPIEMAGLLKSHFAFWPTKIRLVEGD